MKDKVVVPFFEVYDCAVIDLNTGESIDTRLTEDHTFEYSHERRCYVCTECGQTAYINGRDGTFHTSSPRKKALNCDETKMENALG